MIIESLHDRLARYSQAVLEHESMGFLDLIPSFFIVEANFFPDSHVRWCADMVYFLL